MRRMELMVTGTGTCTNTVIDTHATFVGRMTTTGSRRMVFVCVRFCMYAHTY